MLRNGCLGCAIIFWPKRIYLVSEAFRISKARYGLVDKNGAKLTITGGAFGQAGSRSSNTLSVVEDLYFGVRHVKQLAPDLFERGPGSELFLKLMTCCG
jgi:hypothetical protein